MALPVINVPTYSVAVPSTKEKITFRPFLVKEEKILLLALEEGSDDAIARGIKQIIHNCTFDQVDVEELATFDLEFVFLRIRSKSVGEKATINVLCEDDGETYVETEVDLEKIEVTFPEGHTNNIKLTDEVGVVMNYPDIADMYRGIGEGETAIDFSMGLIKSSLQQIFDGEIVHERIDFTDDELVTFLESLTSEQFGKLQQFYETMPRLSHTVTVTNPNTKKKNKVTLEGLNSFFV